VEQINSESEVSAQLINRIGAAVKATFSEYLKVKIDIGA